MPNEDQASQAATARYPASDPGARRRSRWVPLARTVLLVCLASAMQTLGAQGELTGRILAAGSHAPIAGATVGIQSLSRSTVSDSAGRFRLTGLPAGEFVLSYGAMGFAPDTATIDIDENEVALQDFTLQRAQVLPRTTVKAEAPPGVMDAFESRRKMDAGHFITRDELEKAEGGRMKVGDMLAKLPGVESRRAGTHAWVASFRAVNQAGGCAFCGAPKFGPKAQHVNSADFALGARDGCYMDVYENGALIFDSTHPDNGLFDVNTLRPEDIEGVEVYTSAAQMPAEFNRTAQGCGAVVIWTRR